MWICPYTGTGSRDSWVDTVTITKTVFIFLSNVSKTALALASYTTCTFNGNGSACVVQRPNNWLYFVGRASRCICAIKNRLGAALFILSFSRTSGTARTNCTVYIYIYSIPPDDVLQICPKHVEVDWRNKLRNNNASCWLLLHTNPNNITKLFSFFQYFFFILSSTTVKST